MLKKLLFIICLFCLSGNMASGEVVTLHQGYEDDSKASTPRPKSPPVNNLCLIMENQLLYFDSIFEGASFQIVQNVGTNNNVL